MYKFVEIVRDLAGAFKTRGAKDVPSGSYLIAKRKEELRRKKA